MSRPSRRQVLAAAGLAAAGLAPIPLAADAPGPASERTKFQIACMTLPYSAFPLTRALAGIRQAGFSYCAWGVNHREESGEKRPVIAKDAAPREAAELARRCRGQGLEPLMMFSTVYPEHPQGLPLLTQRLKQASAANVPQVLTFGHTRGGNRKLWIERFRKLGPIAEDLNVALVVKQHGGETGTGAACAEIIREVDHPRIRVNYDAGNVMDYLNVDPLPDIRKCAEVVHSLCIKDHRNWPRDQDCGPGLGEIDHYRLLAAVAHLGRELPLCCENIFAPLLPRPEEAAGVDRLARRARIFLETVVAGLAEVSE